jgi:AbrB family looped-hinge helix DNA binding protein
MVRKIYASRLTSKGQLTVPLAIRKRLGLRSGDHVEFIPEADRTTVRRIPPKDDPLKKYVGAFPALKSRKEINDWIREMREGR